MAVIHVYECILFIILLFTSIKSAKKCDNNYDYECIGRLAGLFLIVLLVIEALIFLSDLNSFESCLKRIGVLE